MYHSRPSRFIFFSLVFILITLAIIIAGQGILQREVKTSEINNLVFHAKTLSSTEFNHALRLAYADDIVTLPEYNRLMALGKRLKSAKDKKQADAALRMYAKQ